MACKFCGHGWSKDVTNAELINVLNERKREARKAFDAYRKHEFAENRGKTLRHLAPVIIALTALCLISITHPAELALFFGGLSAPHLFLFVYIPLLVIVLWLLYGLFMMNVLDNEEWDSFSEEFPEHADILHYMHFR